MITAIQTLEIQFNITLIVMIEGQTDHYPKVYGRIHGKDLTIDKIVRNGVDMTLIQYGEYMAERTKTRSVDCLQRFSKSLKQIFNL